MVPPDGEYETTKYPGSGQTVAQVIAGAFSQFATSVHTVTSAVGTMPAAFKTKSLIRSITESATLAGGFMPWVGIYTLGRWLRG